jgi:hypothetical protein
MSQPFESPNGDGAPLSFTDRTSGLAHRIGGAEEEVNHEPHQRRGKRRCHKSNEAHRTKAGHGNGDGAESAGASFEAAASAQRYYRLPPRLPNQFRRCSPFGYTLTILSTLVI